MSSDELLRKCTHGKTQNCNEGLNNIIWSRCHKNTFVNMSTLEMGVASAVLYFNEGTAGLKRVFRKLNLNDVTSTDNIAYTKDRKRVRDMNRKALEPVTKRRKQLRAISKGLLDEEEAEKSYSAGKF